MSAEAMALQSLQKRLDATTEDPVDWDRLELAGWLLYHRQDLLPQSLLSTAAAENFKSRNQRWETMMELDEDLPSMVGPEGFHQVVEAPQAPRNTGTLDSKMKMLVWDVKKSRSVPFRRLVIANRPGAQRRLDLRIHNTVRTWAANPILALWQTEREDKERLFRYKREEYGLSPATGVSVEEWERHRRQILEWSSNGAKDIEHIPTQVHHLPGVDTLLKAAGLDSAAGEVCKLLASRAKA
ncbi:hypothetical protein LTS07_006012 [Exophiala sideris]|uniref:Uncharacterized protein n=1 Tax=Exophiala sideris TaxID=1016849 RepID=A0ABR0J7N4_9EURO|nr:hypothetical protein LTS07_006012 [Exophiala sideris]KAK5058178.1 hypothetical protein LTR69_007176 [Exophiala sideris]KAK5182138.1 hypothetical protein LTR44_005739 [Eurotiomycetes sp. CCFEE 6388]